MDVKLRDLVSHVVLTTNRLCDPDKVAILNLRFFIPKRKNLYWLDRPLWAPSFWVTDSVTPASPVGWEPIKEVLFPKSSETISVGRGGRESGVTLYNHTQESKIPLYLLVCIRLLSRTPRRAAHSSCALLHVGWVNRWRSRCPREHFRGCPCYSMLSKCRQK